MRKLHKTTSRVKLRTGADSTLLILIGIFLLIGVIAIYDATVILAQDLYGDAYRFVFLQLGWIIIGLLGFYLFLNLKLSLIKKLSIPLFIFTLGILLLLALFGVLPCNINFMFAPCVNGANRWFYLNPAPLPNIPIIGVLGFQPSELAKFSLVLFLAAKLEKSIKLNKPPFKDFMLISGLVAFLVVLQPNLSTASLIFMIGVAMFVASGADLKALFITTPLMGLTGLLFMLSSAYRRQRLMTFLSGSGTEDLAAGYHINQIQIALGSGGMFGVGFGQSRQKFQYLPEVFADSIFAVWGEELGFVGASFLVLLFAALVYKGYRIAINTPDLFAKLIAVGVTTWIGLQFFVNIGAMTRVIPLTGIPLPLISYGGSSLVFIMMGLGVLANVSKSTSSVDGNAKL